MMLKEGHTSPLPTAKSVRPDEWRGLTSMKAGVIRPVAFIPLLREDRLRASVTIQVSSEETLKVIVNPVRVRAEAFLIPKTVLERFQGSLEMLNRSYEGEPAPAGMGATPKWFIQHPYLPAGDKGHELFDGLGIHWSDGAKVNTDLVESYNQLVNWMRRKVSPGLSLVSLTNTTALPAFWESWRFADIKPSFDANQMEGAVELALTGAMPVRGFAFEGAETASTGYNVVQHGTGASIPPWKPVHKMAVEQDYAIQAEAAGSSAMITLANIEMAKETQAFAKMRDRYKSVPDEYLIDLLMAGINVPDADLRQPIRLAQAEGVIGQTQRYATDGASLETSVANGMAMLNFTMNTPAVNTGGIVLVCLSIVPEQLYERLDDVSLAFVDGEIGDAKTPRYVEDYLDPQKVEVVPNSFPDALHSDPGGVFGYAPLNYQWRRSFSRVGGKFKRPVPDAFVEDRQRIWSVEKTDPELSADFYLCPSPFPHTVFADTEADPYEVITVINASIVGNTVFGPGFEEDRGSYDRIIASIDQDRINQEAFTVEAAKSQPVTDLEADVKEGTENV